MRSIATLGWAAWLVSGLLWGSTILLGQQSTSDKGVLLFDGKQLEPWQGNRDLWSVQDGEIVGKSPGIDRNEFLVHPRKVRNFRLTLEVKLVPNSANSGVQFRSQRRDDGGMYGYQADIGAGWWGKLYHEHGRGQLWDKPGDQYVKVGDWNLYEIRAVGHHIQTFLNGHKCVDLEDPQGELEGYIGLQIHSGGPMEVRFRNIRLEELPDK
ncbi:MAG: hypothetical protein KatS3mg110_0848 [Pirellulaceae bacterium]|nr:MAG: hypothetical protein KatS3mg110_0848 [Pirellulaceae bacterium]